MVSLSTAVVDGVPPSSSPPPALPAASPNGGSDFSSNMSPAAAAGSGRAPEPAAASSPNRPVTLPQVTPVAPPTPDSDRHSEDDLVEANGNGGGDNGGGDGTSVGLCAFIKGVFTRDVLRVIFVQMSTAMLLGYVIGYVGVYNTLISINDDCGQYTTQRACTSVEHTVCAWRLNDAFPGDESDVCYFSDLECSMLDEQTCRDESSKCFYDNDDAVCKHLTGFDPVDSGIFAGAMTLGGMIGSMLGGIVVANIGRKYSLMLAAVINIIGTILIHVSRATDEYWMLVVARFVLGVGTGLGCIASPMYAEEMTPEAYRGPVGTLFQVFITLGIALAAAMGLIVEPHDFGRKQNNEVRIQMFNMVQSILCVCSLLVSSIVPESNTYIRIRAEAKEKKAKEQREREAQEAGTVMEFRDGSAASSSAAVNVNDNMAHGASASAPNPSQQHIPQPGAIADEQQQQGAPQVRQQTTSNSAHDDTNGAAGGHDDQKIRVYPLTMMVLPLFAAFILCMGQQLTGINAIMTYAPTITKAMGLAPMLGNFVIMIWNFVTTLISIPASKFFTLRQMYVTGVAVATCALLVTGVPTYPGVYDNETGRHGLAGLGIFAFILAFEVGMGPAFYVLSQALFPLSFRPKGSAFTMAVQYAFNLVINVCFPIAQQGLSGGASGNQDQGLAIIFFFFTVCGAISFVLLFFFLYPFDEEKADAKEQARRERIAMEQL